MNKKDMVAIISKTTSLSKEESSMAISTLLQEIVDSVRRREEVRLTGFGTFTVVRRSAKIGTNPLNGEKISIPERDLPVFRPSKLLKEEF